MFSNQKFLALSWVLPKKNEIFEMSSVQNPWLVVFYRGLFIYIPHFYGDCNKPIEGSPFINQSGFLWNVIQVREKPQKKRSPKKKLSLGGLF